jgi:hypothetical protein
MEVKKYRVKESTKKERKIENRKKLKHNVNTSAV